MRFGVAMIASIFHPSVGGIQTHTLHLSRKLRERDVDAFVVTRQQAGLPRYEEIHGVPTYRVGLAGGGWAAGGAAYVLEGVRWLAASRGRWRIAHAQQMLSPMSLGLLARALLGRRLVVNPHACGPIGDIETLRRGRRVTGRIRLAAAVKMADAFVAISRDIRNELTSLGVDEKRIWEIPNGVDTGHFHPVDGASKRQLRQQIGLPEGWMVIYAGRLAPEKGIDVLIDAWPRVVRQRPDAQLTLVGAGSDLGDLCNRVESLGIERSVHFVGECSDVAPLLQAADAFVLPSKTEGLPVSLLEAMACGLPVVATQVGGSRQVLEDGVTGGLVPPNEPVALADKLLEANRGTSWGARARRQIAAGYSLDLIADRFVAMYENLLRLEPNSIPGAARRTAA